MTARGTSQGATEQRLDDPGGHERRARDAAMALPVIGILLLASPLTAAFGMAGTVLGVPAVVVHVFLAWALLIWGAWYVGQRLRVTPARRPQRLR